MRFGSSRFVRMSTGWTSMWPDAGVGRPPPDGGAKYAVATTAGPAVAGRPTTGVEVRAGTRVRERLAVDTATGVLLRRQQLDDRGRVVRQLEFATFEPTPPALHLPPQRFRADGATSTRAAALQAPYRAPASLPRGYARLGTYRRADVLQVVYGDGLYGLSVFEQPGRIDWSQLPRDGRTVEVAGHPGRSYVWPGGHLVTWQGGSAAYTIVGDGPEADVLAAAASIRGAAALSTAQRMRQAARELVSTLSGRG
jgi:negative regulator of sigma E activity